MLSGLRGSPLPHPVAALRTTLGLTQKEIGDVANRAARTIQPEALGKPALSEELAVRLAESRGIDERWLLEGNPEAPPRRGIFLLGTGRGGGSYTEADYEFHCAILEAPIVPRQELAAAIRKAKKSKSEWVDISAEGNIQS